MTTETAGVVVRAAPPEDWSVPLPSTIPRPTYAPAATAFGLTFFFWGFVTSPIVLGVGLVVTVLAVRAWIGELCHGD